jgi:hypothetical protein
MEWNINKGSNVCTVCGKELVEEEEYFSALFDGSTIFHRKDFCAVCWQNNAEKGFFSFWKTKVPKKDKPVQKFVNTEIFLDIFFRLEKTDDVHKKNLRYVLSLYLIRKRIFRLKSFKKQDENELIIIYYPKEDREFDVINPNLKESEIAALTSEMNQLLNYPYIEQDVIQVGT